MKHHQYSRILSALPLAVALTVSGFGGASAMHAGAKKPRLKGTIVIGQITSLSGPFSAYGTEEVDGFQAGLHYATAGKMKVDSARLVVKTYNDAAGASNNPDPTAAASAAKSAIQSDHAQILQCCASSASAIAVAGVAKDFNKILMVAPAADDSLAGINRNTFRTSRESSQDAETGAAYAYHKLGKNYMTLAQDYAFGHGQVDAWKGLLDKMGANDEGDVFFPLTTTDFTPYVQRILAKKPSWVFLACAGTQCGNLVTALDQQGVLDQVRIMTGLGNIATFPAFGDAGTKISYISVYYYKFPKTKANTYLVKYIQQHYHRPADIFDQDAFAAGQAIVQALHKTHSTSAGKMIKVLEGMTVHGPKGDYTLRKQDHVALQPMYIAALVKNGSTFTAKLLATRKPSQTAPPMQKHNW
jgi:branched-chain amino acid transport system substrate-binding protein